MSYKTINNRQNHKRSRLRVHAEKSVSADDEPPAYAHTHDHDHACTTETTATAVLQHCYSVSIYANMPGMRHSCVMPDGNSYRTKKRCARCSTEMPKNKQTLCVMSLSLEAKANAQRNGVPPKTTNSHLARRFYTVECDTIYANACTA